MDSIHALYVDAPARPRNRWVASILLFPLCVYFLLNQGTPTALDTAAVVIHQVGNGLLGSFGGPLLQVLLPCALVLFFYVHRFSFGVQVFLFWLGQSLLSIGFLIRVPARKSSVLFEVGQSWHALLDGFGFYGMYLGFCFLILAALCFLIVLVLPLYMSR